MATRNGIEHGDGRGAQTPNRVDSTLSEANATPAEPLLAGSYPRLPAEFTQDGSISLEHFFRTCAETLARHQGLSTRATTFSSDGLRRADTSEFEAVPAIDERPSRPPQRVVPRGSPSRERRQRYTESIQFERAQEWNAKYREWSWILEHLPDVWRYYFPDCNHGPGAEHDKLHRLQCHPLASKRVRVQAQRSLLLARLCLEHGSSIVRDCRGFLPWLSLVGYKLQQIDSFSRPFSWVAFAEPKDDLKSESEADNLLSYVLRYFYDGPSEYLARHNEFCISWMLDFCYAWGILPQPLRADDFVLQDNFRNLVYALWCLNIIQTPRYQLTFTYDWNRVEQRLPVEGLVAPDSRTETATQQSFEEIERRLQEKRPNLPQAMGDNVRCTDLNIQALRNIGGLRIVWTTCDRDHLFLDQESGVLRVAWFSRVLIPEFYKYMPILGRNDVYRTWEMLLGHRTQQHDYTDLEKIAMPPELRAFNKLRRRRRVFGRQVPSGELRHDPRQVPDIFEKYESHPNLPRSVPYSYFGAYEARVRTLRHYMDHRKPTGFRNLWHDRRDTLTYYTFWAVIIFGGLSVLLAALGLAVGILQAYAAFKSIPS